MARRAENGSLQSEGIWKDASIDPEASEAEIVPMSTVPDSRQPAFDPFGEPMAPARSCDRAAERRGYGETRRAAILFWALALAFLAGRIYFDVGSPPGTFAAGAAPITDIRIAALP
jgi:hypothetical protein